MKHLIFIPLVLMGSFAYAQTSQATPVEWIDWLRHFIPTEGSQIAVAALVLEFVLRYIPSVKPVSLFLAISTFCKHLSDLLEAVSLFLDKIIGQRTASIKPNMAFYNPPKYK